MISDKVHKMFCFKQSKWLEKSTNFNTQKKNQAVVNFEKDFYKLLNNEFHGETMENVRNRIKVEFIEESDTEKNIKEQSKLTFNEIHKSYTKYDS